MWQVIIFMYFWQIKWNLQTFTWKPDKHIALRPTVHRPASEPLFTADIPFIHPVRAQSLASHGLQIVFYPRTTGHWQHCAKMSGIPNLSFSCLSCDIWDWPIYQLICFGSMVVTQCLSEFLLENFIWHWRARFCGSMLTIGAISHMGGGGGQ